MSVFRQYKRFRDNISSLSCDDALRVIWAYSRYLWDRDFQMPSDFEISSIFVNLEHKAQWLTQWDLEVLAKEIILNAGDFGYGSWTLRRWDTLAVVVNALREFEEQVSAVNQENILIELNRIAHRQFVWQQNTPIPMMARHFKIFNTTEINEICLSRLGLSIEQVYLCGVAFVATYLESPFLSIPAPSDIPGLSDDVVKKFLSFLCRPIWGLRNILQSDQKYDASFFYAYNSLRTYPLILMKIKGKDSLVCPLPTLLIWRFTAGLYYELVRDPRFSNAFGASFQAYVGEAVCRTCPGDQLDVVAEQRYGSEKARKDSVDWIISDNDATIFLECKTKRLGWGGKVALDDLTALETDLDHMANAIVQVYKTIDDYRSGQYVHYRFHSDRKIYPVVVTLEDWHIFLVTSQKIRDLVVLKLGAVHLSLSVLDEMPYSIWSIGDLEAGMQIVNQFGVRNFIDGKICDPEMKQWEWHGYMAHKFKGKYSRRELFRNDFDAIFARLIPSG